MGKHHAGDSGAPVPDYPHGAALHLLLESFGMLVLGWHCLDFVHRLRRHMDWNQKRGFFTSAEEMGRGARIYQNERWVAQ